MPEKHWMERHLDPEPGKEVTSTIWRVERGAFASDGKAALLVDSEETGTPDPPVSIHRIVATMRAGQFDLEVNLEELRAWVGPLEQTFTCTCTPCPTCGGYGDIECRCPECEEMHMTDCPDCNGEVCPLCDGEHIRLPRVRAGLLHGLVIDRQLLAKHLPSLTGDQIGLGIVRLPGAALLLGGNGRRLVVMPLAWCDRNVPEFEPC